MRLPAARATCADVGWLLVSLLRAIMPKKQCVRRFYHRVSHLLGALTTSFMTRHGKVCSGVRKEVVAQGPQVQITYKRTGYSQATRCVFSCASHRRELQ